MQLNTEQALKQAIAAHKDGKLNEAENIYRAILQSQPNHPDANHNLGVIAVSLNQIEAAVPLFKTALDTVPNEEQFWLSYVDALVRAERLKDAKQAIKKAKKKGFDAKKLRRLISQPKRVAKSDAEAHNNLGNTLLGRGRLVEAEASYKQAIVLKPNYAEAYNNLGNTLQGLNRLVEAEASYNRAIALKPNYAEAHYNLGVALHGLDRLTEAEANYKKAIASKPYYPEAHNNLGIALQGLGRLTEAEASFNQAIALKPDFATAHNNLGNTLEELGRLTEAEASHKEAIAYKPDYAEAHNNLGIALRGLGRFNEQKASFEQAIALKPDYAEAHNNLGNTLHRLGWLTEAEASFKQAIALKPDYAEAHNNLGGTLTGLGRLTEAEACFNQAIALKPDFAEAYRQVTIIKKLDSQDERFLKMLKLHRDNVLSDDQRCHINFGLAKVHEDLENFELAFIHYAEGNELRKKLLNYHINQDVELFANIKSTYPRLEQCSVSSSKLQRSATPIFVVGMPRSGTTLIEQIVSSHRLVTGAGELDYVEFFGSAMATGCSDISHEALLNFRHNYLEKLKRHSGGKQFITDKMPQNFRYIGLLAAAFPEAKFIHVKRHSSAVCWGNFKTYFSAKDLGYAWAMDDIVTYFKLYQNLMEFWDSVLHRRIYNLDYELLTDNQEPETRKLIDYIGLDWDENCLFPEGNTRSVLTASSLQVRQKVYRGSSDEWKKYELFLDGAFEGLSSS